MAAYSLFRDVPPERGIRGDPAEGRTDKNRPLEIGVFDYQSCCACIASNFRAVFPDATWPTDPQGQIQGMMAEIMKLRRELAAKGEQS